MVRESPDLRSKKSGFFRTKVIAFECSLCVQVLAQLEIDIRNGIQMECGMYRLLDAC